MKEHIIQIQCDDLFDPPEMTPSNVQSSRAGETVSDYCDLHTEPDKIPNESQGKRPPPTDVTVEGATLSLLFIQSFSQQGQITLHHSAHTGDPRQLRSAKLWSSHQRAPKAAVGMNVHPTQLQQSFPDWGH